MLKILLSILVVYALTSCESNKKIDNSVAPTLLPSPQTSVAPIASISSTSTKVLETGQSEVANVELSTWKHPLKELFSTWQFKKNELISVQLFKNNTYSVFTISSFEPNDTDSSLDILKKIGLYSIFNIIGEKNGWFVFELRTDRHDWKVYLDKKKKLTIKAFDSDLNKWENFNQLPCDNIKCPLMNQDIIKYVKTNYLATVDPNLQFYIDIQEPDFSCQIQRYLRVELVGTGLFNFLDYDSETGFVSNSGQTTSLKAFFDSNGEDLIINSPLRKEYEKIYSSVTSRLGLKRIPNDTGYFYCTKTDCEVPKDDSEKYGLHISIEMKKTFLIRLTRYSDTLNTFFYASLTNDGIVSIIDDFNIPVN
jgi:hypothetical protein